MRDLNTSIEEVLPPLDYDEEKNICQSCGILHTEDLNRETQWYKFMRFVILMFVNFFFHINSHNIYFQYPDLD